MCVVLIRKKDSFASATTGGGKLPNGDVWQELITETEAGYARDGFTVLSVTVP